MAQPKRPYPSKATTYNIPVLTYLTPPQKAALDKLSTVTRIPKTTLLRESVDDLLKKHAKLLKTGGAK
jgi:hypothetical protein